MIKSREMSGLAKKLIAFGITLILFSVLKTGSVVYVNAAGNYHDTVFEYYINTDECEITDLSTPFRQKRDATSAYVYNKGSNSDISYIRVMGQGNGNTAYYDCTYGRSRDCKKGQARYLPNLVHERRYANASLLFDPGDGHHNHIYILWSPDSI